MDRAMLEMQIEADLLADGGDVVSPPAWLVDIANGIDAASAGCPHLLSGATLPIYYYPASQSAMCALCAVSPPPECFLCGAATDRGVVAACGLLLITVALCAAHSVMQDAI